MRRWIIPTGASQAGLRQSSSEYRDTAVMPGLAGRATYSLIAWVWPPMRPMALQSTRRCASPTAEQRRAAHRSRWRGAADRLIVVAWPDCRRVAAEPKASGEIPPCVFGKHRSPPLPAARRSAVSEWRVPSQAGAPVPSRPTVPRSVLSCLASPFRHERQRRHRRWYYP
jgi:hypothetical protein